MARASFWIITLTGAFAAALWFLPRVLSPPLLGQVYAAVALLYALLMLMGAWFGSQHELQDAWTFAALAALCLTLPDALLAQSGVVGFPSLGAQRAGGVPLYVPALWLAPLLVALWIGEIVHRRSAVAATGAALIASALAFGAVEWGAARLSLWLPRNVATVQGVALYALAAKTAAGLAAWLLFTQVQHRTVFTKALAAAALAAFYAGAALGARFALQRFG